MILLVEKQDALGVLKRPTDLTKEKSHEDYSIPLFTYAVGNTCPTKHTDCFESVNVTIINLNLKVDFNFIDQLRHIKRIQLQISQ